MVDFGCPAEADTVSKGRHGESVLASVPRGTLCQSGDPCGFCLVPAIFFSAVSSPFHIAILALGVCCFSPRPGRRVVSSSRQKFRSVRRNSG